MTAGVRMSTIDLLELAEMNDYILAGKEIVALPRLYKLAEIYPEVVEIQSLVKHCQRSFFQDVNASLTASASSTTHQCEPQLNKQPKFDGRLALGISGGLLVAILMVVIVLSTHPLMLRP